MANINHPMAPHLPVQAVIGAIGAERSIKAWCARSRKLKWMVNKTKVSLCMQAYEKRGEGGSAWGGRHAF